MGTEALWAPVLGAVASTIIGGALAPKQKAAPQPDTPAAAPAAAVAPDSSLYKAANANVASSQGPASTLLTGLAGVPNSSLNLGRNTSLGA